jgi:hypothetical protein
MIIFGIPHKVTRGKVWRLSKNNEWVLSTKTLAQLEKHALNEERYELNKEKYELKKAKYRQAYAVKHKKGPLSCNQM